MPLPLAETATAIAHPLARSLPFLTGKNILLLQGPVGHFFARLQHAFETNGNTVTRINFNAGDWMYGPQGVNWKGPLSEWPAYLEKLIVARRIDLVLMFADCRPIHQAAIKVLEKISIDYGVFEEGYIRPDHITLERGGVNANSPQNWPWLFSAAPQTAPQAPVKTVGKTFRHKATAAFCYFLAGTLGQVFYPNYLHHKAFYPRQILWWARGFLRKFLSYRKDQRGAAQLTGALAGQYFFVPLQVYDDSQVVFHSDYDDMKDFIADIVASFATGAPDDMRLVFKHHPMDRGHRHYGRLIAQLGHYYGIADKLHYYHDLHLPDVLNAARGIVTINSTVGLESLHHARPTKVMGRAFYDLPGLTWQGDLHEFWQVKSPTQSGSYPKFRDLILEYTQINGSFYKTCPGADGFAGLRI